MKHEIGLSVSVIIPTYNRPEALKSTYSDLALQSHPADEIIIIDQTQVKSVQVFDQKAELLKTGNLRYFHHSFPNAQRARNRGILESVGDILIFVDDDVQIPANFIERHLENYLEDPELDGVAGQTLQEGQIPTDILPEKFYWPHIGWMFFPLHYEKQSRVINWPSCNGSIRREVALAVGGFDEQFIKTWWDDSDFSWRLHQWGAKIIFDPSASLVHLLDTSGGSRPQGRGKFVRLDIEYWATLLYFWRKNFDLFRVWRHLWWWLNHRIFCTRLLIRPHLFLVSIYYLLQGYFLTSRRLKEGPIYISKHEE